MRRTSIGVAVLLAIALFARASAARDPVAAEALFRSGREAMRRADYATACAKFAESQELDPAAGTALNLSECEEKQGHVASAWQRMREALDLLPPGDDRIPFATKRTAELDKRAPRLTVRLAPGAPQGTTVVRDDVEMNGALFGFPQPIDPGRHVVRASAPGRAARSYEVVLAEGSSRELIVEPGAPAAAAAAVVPVFVHRTDQTRRVAGFIVGGVGVAAAALGVVTGLTVIDRGHERARLCPGNVCPDAQSLASAESVDSSGRTLSVVSTAAFAVGAAGLLAGAYLLWTSSREVAVSPAIGPGSATLTFTRSF